MKRFKVYIYDSESGCDSPMECDARNESEVRAIGNRYIRAWRLVGAAITRIVEVEK